MLVKMIFDLINTLISMEAEVKEMKNMNISENTYGETKQS